MGSQDGANVEVSYAWLSRYGPYSPEEHPGSYKDKNSEENKVNIPGTWNNF